MFKEFEIVTGWEEPLQLLCSKCTLSWDKLRHRENVSSVVNSDRSHGESLISAHPCECVTQVIPCSVVGIWLNDIPCRELLLLTMNYISILPPSHLDFVLSKFTWMLSITRKSEEEYSTRLFLLTFHFLPSSSKFPLSLLAEWNNPGLFHHFLHASNHFTCTSVDFS